MAHRRATASITPLRFFLLCTAHIRSFGMTHTIGISFIVALPIVCCDARSGCGQSAVSWLTLTESLSEAGEPAPFGFADGAHAKLGRLPRLRPGIRANNHEVGLLRHAVGHLCAEFFGTR